jgi:hypothetical protein
MSARNLREAFLELLLREGGERAVKYFLSNPNCPGYPSESELEAAHNRAVKAILETEEFRSLPPLERLVALTSWLQPATWKKPKNARIFCPGYAEAEDAHRQAVDDALLELPRGVVHMLREGLRFRAYRLWALKREPRAEIRAEAGPYQVRLFREDRDAWWAELSQSGQCMALSPTYLRAGHISSARLLVQADYREDAAGRPVVVVLVEHPGDFICQSDCPLPAAMEFYLSDSGWRGTPWRVKVHIPEALLPPVGEWKIRQGDMVFWLTKAGRGDLELPEASPPEWTRSHRPEGVVRWVQSRWGPWGVVEGIEVRFAHPEHPRARVWLSGSGGPLLLDARPAEGWTQYVPPARVD